MHSHVSPKNVGETYYLSNENMLHMVPRYGQLKYSLKRFINQSIRCYLSPSGLAAVSFISIRYLYLQPTLCPFGIPNCFWPSFSDLYISYQVCLLSPVPLHLILPLIMAIFSSMVWSWANCQRGALFCLLLFIYFAHFNVGVFQSWVLQLWIYLFLQHRICSD